MVRQRVRQGLFSPFRRRNKISEDRVHCQSYYGEVSGSLLACLSDAILDDRMVQRLDIL